MTDAPAPETADDGSAALGPNKTFGFLIGGTLLMGAAAYGLSLIMNTPLGAALALDWGDMMLGLAATAPLALFLLWFMRSESAYIGAFRDSQIDFFAKIGFEFTWLRIVMMALAAGVCEELLFRGVFQTYADRFTPTLAAIVGTNIIFGLLHWRTALYAVIAGTVGVYLGILFWATGNLAAPMVTHAVYDFIALWFTRDAIKAHRNAS
ncbi:MAG: CPBP family intramembrane glutamic endopeptidase [Pseudomonadota bacterium]